MNSRHFLLTILLVLTSGTFLRAQTIPAGSTGSTYNSVAGTNTLNAGDTHTYTGTNANGAVLLGAGHPLVINGTLQSTDTGGGPRGVRLANSAGIYTITIGAAGTIQAQSNDGIKNQSSSSQITLTNNGQILALNPTPNSPYSTAVGQALDFDGNTGASSITNNASATIRADGADAIRVGSNMAITNDGSIIGNSKINDNAANNNNTYTASNMFDTSEGVDFRSATNSSLINNGTVSGTRHGVDGDVGTPVITITNNATGIIIGKNGSGIGSDSTNTIITNYKVDNRGLIRGDYAGAGNIVDRQGLASNDGDGDGVDIDGAATIINRSTGIIKGTGAGGFDSGGRANGSDGVSIGGGAVTNDGTIEGANNGIIVNNDSVASRSGLAATTITNNATGTITGLNGFAIRLENKLGDSRDDDMVINFGTITATGAIPNPTATVLRQYGEADVNSVGMLNGDNYAGTGSARFIRGDGAAIQTGEGADTVTNHGTITGNSGRAISLEGGNDTLYINGGAAVITGNIDGGVGTNTATINPGTANSFSYAGQISNFSTVTVQSGLVHFTGANSYTGETKVTGGTLFIDGAGSIGTGDVTVASGAKLDISGLTAASYSLGAAQTLTVGGIIDATGKTFIANGQVNPGASPGLMTVTGGFTLADTAQLNLEVNGFARGITYDALDVSGLLTLAGTISVTGTQTYGLGDMLDFLNFGTLDASAFNVSTDLLLPMLDPGLAWDVSNVTNNGSVTVVPEPATVGLLAGGVALLLASRRRRQVQVNS